MGIGPIAAGIFFALVPALGIGLLMSFLHPVIGLIFGLGVFGLGLDCCFRGSK